MKTFTFTKLRALLALTAAVVAVSVCWVGCGRGGDNPSGGGSGGGGDGGGGGGGSSSAVYDEPVTYGGQTYKTIVIDD